MIKIWCCNMRSSYKMDIWTSTLQLGGSISWFWFLVSYFLFYFVVISLSTSCSRMFPVFLVCSSWFYGLSPSRWCFLFPSFLLAAPFDPWILDFGFGTLVISIKAHFLPVYLPASVLCWVHFCVTWRSISWGSLCDKIARWGDSADQLVSEVLFKCCSS